MGAAGSYLHGTAVRYAVERKASELVDDYQSGGRACAYSCIRTPGAVCEAGNCVIVQERDAGLP